MQAGSPESFGAGAGVHINASAKSLSRYLYSYVLCFHVFLMILLHQHCIALGVILVC